MFLSLFSIFSSSFVLALSGALMPGPVLRVTVSESVRRGAAVGPLIILGHGILELLLVLALLAGIVAFYGGHILADLAWYSMISLGISKGRHFFTDKSYRRLIGFCAGFLLLFSLYFFYSGIEKIV